MPGKLRKTFVIILHRNKDLRGLVGGVQPVSGDLYYGRTQLQEASSILQMAADRKKERKNTEAPRFRSLQKKKNLCMFYI